MSSGNPIILAFSRRPLMPLSHWERVFLLDGRLIQFIGERWRVEDVWTCPYPVEVDPNHPSEAIMLRLVSVATGVSSSALSPESLESLWADRQDRESGVSG